MKTFYLFGTQMYAIRLAMQKMFAAQKSLKAKFIYEINIINIFFSCSIINISVQFKYCNNYEF